MNTEVLAAFGGAVIAAVVALVSVLLTNYANNKRHRLELEHSAAMQERDLLIERGEELYELSDRWLNGLFGYNMRRAAVMQGKLTYADATDLDIKAGEEGGPSPFGRIEMIVDVYFDEVRPLYDAVIKERTNINEINTDHYLRCEAGDHDGTRFLDAHTKAQLRLESAGSDFQKAIRASIRRITCS